MSIASTEPAEFEVYENETKRMLKFEENLRKKIADEYKAKLREAEITGYDRAKRDYYQTKVRWTKGLQSVAVAAGNDHEGGEQRPADAPAAKIGQDPDGHDVGVVDALDAAGADQPLARGPALALKGPEIVRGRGGQLLDQLRLGPWILRKGQQLQPVQRRRIRRDQLS